MSLELSIHSYCAEDDTYAVNGDLKRPLDLKQINEKAKGAGRKIVFMPRLKVLVIIFDRTTVHLHANGKIVVNHAATVDAARALLAQLL